MICTAESARKCREKLSWPWKRSCAVEGLIRMNHIHNEAVLAFLTTHEDNPNVKRFIRKQDEVVRAMAKDLGSEYKEYMAYLEANAGDDASFTMEDLKGLLQPRFVVELRKEEKKEYCCKEFEIGIDELVKPVYIKDEGHFFTIWGKDGRIDIPLRFLEELRKLLRDNNIEYDDEFGERLVLPIRSG